MGSDDFGGNLMPVLRRWDADLNEFIPLGGVLPHDLERHEELGLVTNSDLKLKTTIVAVVADQPSWDVNAADNDEAFTSACEEAFYAGGGSVLLPRMFKGNLESVVPHSVDVIGLGGLPGSGASSEFLCTAAGSGLRFGLDVPFLGVLGSGGSQSGGFLVNGNNVALNPMSCGVGTRSYRAIVIEKALQDGLVLKTTQNSLFELIEVNESSRDNIVFDLGAGGNHMLKCESHSAGRSSVAFRASDEVAGGGPSYPLCNVIENMIMEYTEAASGPMLYHGAGLMNRIVNCEIVSDDPLSTMDVPAIVLVSADYTVDGDLQYSVMEIDGCIIQSNAGSAGLSAFNVGPNAALYLSGFISVVGTGILFNTDPAAVVHDGSTTSYVGVSPATRLVGSDATVKHETRTRMVFGRPAAEPAIQVIQDGEGGSRYSLYGNGMIWYTSGDGVIDTNWYRKAAGCIGSDYAISCGSFTTDGRPSAIVVGQGAKAYDVTLHKPIWSDGVVWRDAMGTAV